MIAFLIGLFAVAAAIVVIAAVVLGLKWLKDYIAERLRNHKNHKVAFADTSELVSDLMASKIEETEAISFDELERMCEETPYVSALIDEETGEITDYESIQADETEENFKARMKQQKGMIIVGA